MDYRKSLEQISEYIFDLNEKDEFKNDSLVREGYLQYLPIYRRNLLGSLIKLFTADFLVTYKYLGDSNFKYFVRAFLIKNRIGTLDISEVSILFPHFLKEQYEVHENDYISYFAQLDLLWSGHHKVNALILPSGIFSFWEKVSLEEDCSDIVINFDAKEEVRLIVRDIEKQLTLRRLC